MRKTEQLEKSKLRPHSTAKKITASFLENAGKFYLERFPASTSRFRTVMTRKIDRSCRAHPEQDREECLALLEAIILRFHSAGFLNDVAYASGLGYSLSQRGYSSSRIAWALRRKGIGEDCLQETGMLVTLPANHDWLCALLWVKKKRLGAFSNGKTSYNQSLSCLARAGFEFETARRALSLTAEEVEEQLTLLHAQD